MAVISVAEEIVNNFSTDDVLFWVEAQLKNLRQMANKKEADKSFVLGQISVGLGEVSDVASSLRKKLNPKPDDDTPVVA